MSASPSPSEPNRYKSMAYFGAMIGIPVTVSIGLIMLSRKLLVKPHPARRRDPNDPDFDVIIVGAGLSGISAGIELRRNCPNNTFALLESRSTFGGTWDLFRYPGVRSDDMFTLGFTHRPWLDAKGIADGHRIQEYIRSASAQFGVDSHIQFDSRVVCAEWSSETSRWTLTVVQTNQPNANPIHRTLTCRFLHMCTGYFDYENGYVPDFIGMDDFAGEIVHPQSWTDDVVYEGKKVVIVGNGATAVTLLPSLAIKAEHVTMLQRAPTYIVPLPQRSQFVDFAQKWLSSSLAYRLIRWQSIRMESMFWDLCQSDPDEARDQLMEMVVEHLGSEFDLKDFTPLYNPWDQPMCLAPDGDFFSAMKNGKASVETDTVNRFTEKGILLDSGKELEADLIVTATGFELQLFGGASVVVDGKPINPPEHVMYMGMMFSNVPNLAISLGYENTAWTLLCELVSCYVARLVRYMDENGYQKCVPVLHDHEMETEPLLKWASGYIERGLHRFPKQGSEWPWKVHHNYQKDYVEFTFGSLDDGVLCFSNPKPSSKL